MSDTRYTGSDRRPSMSGRTASVPAQILSLARLEMTSYFRSIGGLIFALLMPTGLFVVAHQLWYPEEFRDFAVPDMAAIMILTSGLFSVGVAVTQQRVDGTLRTYLSSPLRPAAYITGQVLDRVVVLLLGNGVMVTAAILIWDVEPGGSLVVFFLCAALGLAVMLSFGFLLASRFTSVEVAGGSSSLLFLLVMLASGFFISPDRYPPWLQEVIEYLPFKPTVDLMRLAWSGGDVHAEWVSILVVLAWTVVFIFGASRWFKWSTSGK